MLDSRESEWYRSGLIPCPMDRFTLFLTGMQRSGTTLLAKLLGLFPGVSLLSQPFPLLFVEAKKDFLRGLGRSDLRYPLGHLFTEDGYRQEDFARHLADLRIDGVRLAQIFDEMQDFPGQYTRFDRSDLERVIPDVPSSGFAALLTGLYRELSPEREAAVAGGKETLCEELLPYLLACGWRCVLIVRDPRDVVASLNHGRGPEYGGRPKPTLFNVRNWRKSVAFALDLEGRPGFLWLRYEDLVTDLQTALLRIAQAFGIGPATGELIAGEIRDRAGRVWTGNSSHGERRNVSTASVGSYRHILPPTVARFIEAACLPEMRLLGYPSSLKATEARGILRDFEEPYERIREDLEGDAASPANALLEVRRLDLLADPPGSVTRPWFLSERAHARLREGVEP